MQELVLNRCDFINSGAGISHFTMKPYTPNTINKLVLKRCVLDRSHLNELVDVFPNLEELEIDLSNGIPGYAYDCRFEIETLKTDLDNLGKLKNLRVVKLTDLYEGDGDNDDYINNIPWCEYHIKTALESIRDNFHINTEVEISIPVGLTGKLKAVLFKKRGLEPAFQDFTI